MDISNEDADEILSALSANGFGLPFMARISEHGPAGIAQADAVAWEANRNAVRMALEATEAWSRYRIY